MSRKPGLARTAAAPAIGPIAMAIERRTRAIARAEQERALVDWSSAAAAPASGRAEADAGVEEGGEGAERSAAPVLAETWSTTISESEGRAARRRAPIASAPAIATGRL